MPKVINSKRGFIRLWIVCSFIWTAAMVTVFIDDVLNPPVGYPYYNYSARLFNDSLTEAFLNVSREPPLYPPLFKEGTLEFAKHYRDANPRAKLPIIGEEIGVTVLDVEYLKEAEDMARAKRADELKQQAFPFVKNSAEFASKYIDADQLTKFFIISKKSNLARELVVDNFKIAEDLVRARRSEDIGGRNTEGVVNARTKIKNLEDQLKRAHSEVYKKRQWQNRKKQIPLFLAATIIPIGLVRILFPAGYRVISWVWSGFKKED